MEKDCLFCKIIAGEIPSAKVYEDEYIYAFLDISQVAKGHTLVIPKEHSRNLFDTSEETAAQLFRKVPTIANAIKDTYQAVGMNLLNNNEKEAYQSVFHLHLHLIPKYEGEEGYAPIWPTHEEDYTPEDLQRIAEEINQRMEAT